MIAVKIKEREYSTSFIRLKVSSGTELIKVLEAAAEGGNKIAEINLEELFEKEEE